LFAVLVDLDEDDARQDGSPTDELDDGRHLAE